MQELKIKQAFDLLSKEAVELYLGSQIQEIDRIPSAIEFLRHYVTPNLPVIIRNGASDWEALKKWTTDYLRQVAGDKTVTVAVTPNGYADSPVGDLFMLPEERLMKFKDFLDVIERKVHADGIFYVQHQNSSFLEEFSVLIPDAVTDIPWATAALGKLPDAVNFWMGDGRAITSLHKDHYENIYVVIKGRKKFTLHPPTDLPWIPYKTFVNARYQSNSHGNFEVVQVSSRSDNVCGILNNMGQTKEEPEFASSDVSEPAKSCVESNPVNHFSGCVLHNSPVVAVDVSCTCERQVPWIAVDPLNPDFERFPEYRNAHKMECTVNAGDILYLPSLWFHHVQQEHGTIAVNFWYDMEYDIKYNYFKFLEKLVTCK